MARKPTNQGTGDDTALWRQITGTVKPLKRRAEGRPAPARAEGTAAKQPPASIKASAVKKPAPLSTPPAQPVEPLSAGPAAGLDKRTAQRLRRGQLRIDGRIDLHGMTQAEAHANLVRFITGSAARGRRCVLVITGKGLRGGAGTGVLRVQLPRWLNEPALRPLILSFTPAQPKDGGGGAFYVYLRKAREPGS
ncbi:MAG: Smr/MutS family protein [Alphaproteobacteria bacterium]|nr:Smr/MutS family protein [Alphaproteobacteria bacterium]